MIKKLKDRWQVIAFLLLMISIVPLLNWRLGNLNEQQKTTANTENVTVELNK